MKKSARWADEGNQFSPTVINKRGYNPMFSNFLNKIKSIISSSHNFLEEIAPLIIGIVALLYSTIDTLKSIIN